MIVELRPDPVIYVCGHEPACATRMPVHPADRRTPMHNCTAAALMSLPMVREGEKSAVRLIERDDYLGADSAPGKVRRDAEGRVFMRAEVEHDDGRVDVFVYAPTATLSTEARSTEGSAGGADGRGVLRGARRGG